MAAKLTRARARPPGPNVPPGLAAGTPVPEPAAPARRKRAPAGCPTRPAWRAPKTAPGLPGLKVWSSGETPPPRLHARQRIIAPIRGSAAIPPGAQLPREARHRDDLAGPLAPDRALVPAGDSRPRCRAGGYHTTPASSGLAHDEPLGVMAAVPVGPAGRAAARSGARDRPDIGVFALVQGRQAGHLDRRTPAATPDAPGSFTPPQDPRVTARSSGPVVNGRTVVLSRGACVSK